MSNNYFKGTPINFRRTPACFAASSSASAERHCVPWSCCGWEHTPGSVGRLSVSTARWRYPGYPGTGYSCSSTS
eukprot:2067699-Rhodomonas_salina.1